jgi:SAM-dependent methyltransferase
MPNELARLRSRLESLKKECQQIGSIPPRPPGLRAAVGAFGVALMHRLMFWYAPAIQRTIGGLIGAMEEMLDLVDRGIELELPREIAVGAVGAVGNTDTGLLERRLSEQARALEQERITTIGIESSLREQLEAFRRLEEEQQRREAELGRRLATSDERFALVRREVLDQAQRLAKLPEEFRGAQAPATADAASTNGRGVAGQNPVDEHPALYAALENEFRGARPDAQARRKAYLPLLPRDAAVLDLACGRGEWLELLRREGIAARGVEANRLMVAECRERHLETEEAEPLEYLACTADGSLGAVTVLRLVEHLAFSELVRLLDEVVRVLRPGGAAIFETPNPENILVASRDFYRDPARRRPLPADALRFLVESRGFSSIQVLYLNPAGDSERLIEDGESAVTHRFNRYFYGPRDYAVVGRKV